MKYAISVLCVFIWMSIVIGSFFIDTHNTDTIKQDTIVYVDTTALIKDSIIYEVTNHINSKTNGKNNKDIPELIVNKCLEHNLDICFVMAQTELETRYGTVGAGRETSKLSLFGVGIYPGSKLKKYESYEHAIDSYISILKRNYLSDTRTEQTLLYNYTTKRGSRYASNLNYENELRTIYNRIKKSTNIYNKQMRYVKRNS